jgi:hypothetical protein
MQQPSRLREIARRPTARDLAVDACRKSEVEHLDQGLRSREKADERVALHPEVPDIGRYHRQTDQRRPD